MLEASADWVFVGLQLAGERAAVLMRLIESAKLNGHDPCAQLKDGFERLPSLKNRDRAQSCHTTRAPPTPSSNPVPSPQPRSRRQHTTGEDARMVFAERLP